MRKSGGIDIGGDVAKDAKTNLFYLAYLKNSVVFTFQKRT
jgi:hypothetical protein